MPSARRATFDDVSVEKAEKFLSTPSARRATVQAAAQAGGRADFYPRPPRGGRPVSQALVWCSVVFLSTPSARRATTFRDPLPLGHGDFYPRPPRGGRPMLFILSAGQKISIHALREEGDGAYPPWRPARCNFYPRPPRGGRRCIGFAPVSSLVFLSTPSARRATACNVVQIQLDKISIHALREEGDRIILIQYWPVSNFYPRPPRGGRLGLLRGPCRGSGDFYPRPPRGGRPAGAAACRCG